jgi:hypothetical protein
MKLYIEHAISITILPPRITPHNGSCEHERGIKILCADGNVYDITASSDEEIDMRVE